MENKGELEKEFKNWLPLFSETFFYEKIFPIIAKHHTDRMFGNRYKHIYPEYMIITPLTTKLPSSLNSPPPKLDICRRYGKLIDKLHKYSNIYSYNMIGVHIGGHNRFIQPTCTPFLVVF